MNEEAARALGEGFAKGLVTGATGTILLTALAGSLVWLWFRYPNNARLVVAQIWDPLSWIFIGDGDYAAVPQGWPEHRVAQQ